jgi:hypothetical protein
LPLWGQRHDHTIGANPEAPVAEQPDPAAIKPLSEFLSDF